MQHICETIRRRGPVTFAWFMEQALYHRPDGYYSSGRAQIGRAGDYFTNVSVGSLFGRLLAAQFAEIWSGLGQPNEFSIVEQGAHDGQLAHDILAAKTLPAARYQIIEPFPIWQEQQRKTLQEFTGQTSWHESLDALPNFCGVHVSNELIDAMPVHLVTWTGTEWLERHVTERDRSFVFIALPLSSAALAEQVWKIPQPLPAGYETEVNLAALEWIDSVSRKLDRGFILAADYGFSRAEFYAPDRTAGTLQSYAKQQTLASPLEQIGRADITAHVEWTSLAQHAVECGLSVAGFADQHHFITGILASERGHEFVSTEDAKTKRALQTLLHPGFLGMKFQFLVLAKNADASALSGLRFAKVTIE